MMARITEFALTCAPGMDLILSAVVVLVVEVVR